MFNVFRVNESVAGVLKDHGFGLDEKRFLAEAATKLGKPVDETKWKAATSKTASEYGAGLKRSNPNKFYALAMAIYKKMVGAVNAVADAKPASAANRFGRGVNEAEKIDEVTMGRARWGKTAASNPNCECTAHQTCGSCLKIASDRNAADAKAHAGTKSKQPKPVKEDLDESEINEAEGRFKKTHEFVTADGQHAFRAGKNLDHGTWDDRHYVKHGEGWKHVKDHGYDGHDSAEDAAASAKGNRDHYDSHKGAIKEAEGNTPVRGGIYSLDVVPKKGQKVWSTKWGEKFQFPFDPIDGGNRSKVAFTDPPTHRYVKMGSIATDTLRIVPTEAVKEAEGNNPGSEEFGAGVDLDRLGRPLVVKTKKKATHKAVDPRGYTMMTGTEAECKAMAKGGHSAGVITVEPISEHDLSSEAPEVKNQPEGHDEEKEIKDDPTREKLETAKDEADERKGGPAELAADLRVSIRIEKMGIGRYKRMLAKHTLSDADQKWLEQRVKDLEGCIKDMEAKVPELEAEAKEAGTAKSKDEIKESMVASIKQVIQEIAKG
jgi:hypothetical protein